jgi:hypothetical protein
MVIRGSVNSIRFIFEAIRPRCVVCSNDGTFKRQGVQVMSNREIVLRAFSNRVGNLYKQAEPEQDLGGTYSYMQPDFYPGEGPQQNAIMKALSGLASGAKNYLGSAMSKSQDATMAALGRFKELDPTAQAAILGGLGGAGVGGVGNAVLGNKKKSLIRRLGEGAGVGAAAGAGAGALGGVIGKNKDNIVKGLGKAKDKVVDKAKGGADYLAQKAKELQYRLGFGYKLNSDMPSIEQLKMPEDEFNQYDDQTMSDQKDFQEESSSPSSSLKGTRNEGVNKGLSRLLANPAELAPLLPDEAGISQNLKSIGRQRNPDMNKGDRPSRGRSEG